MPPQTERQTTVSQNSGPGLQKNCQSLRRRRILKTRSTKRLAVRRTILGKPNSSAHAIPNLACAPCGSSPGFSGTYEAEPSSKEFDKSDGENRFELECFPSSPASCLTQPQNGLDHADTKTPCANRPVPTEEFAAPQMQRIFRIAYRITRNREDAEDAMQDACFHAIAHLQDFDGRSRFSTWLTRIAINSSLVILRKRRNARIASLNNAEDFEESKEFQEVADPAPNAEKQCLRRESEMALREEVNALSPSLKDVIEVAQLRECSLRETAKILGLSLSAVKARLFRARRALRNSRKLHPFSQRSANKRA